MSRIAIATLALILALLPGGVTLAGTDSCQPVKKSIRKLNATEKHQIKAIVTLNDTNMSWAIEYIAAGDTEYQQTDAEGWSINKRVRVPLVINRKPTVYGCNRIGTEKLGGDNTVVYTYKRITPEKHERIQKIWISQSTGLPLQSELRYKHLPNRSSKSIYNYDPDIVVPIVTTP